MNEVERWLLNGEYESLDEGMGELKRWGRGWGWHRARGGAGRGAHSAGPSLHLSVMIYEEYVGTFRRGNGELEMWKGVGLA